MLRVGVVAIGLEALFSCLSANGKYQITYVFHYNHILSKSHLGHKILSWYESDLRKKVWTQKTP